MDGKGASIILSIGRYGGFYITLGHTFRISLGWVALTILPRDIDLIFAMATRYMESEKAHD